MKKTLLLFSILGIIGNYSCTSNKDMALERTNMNTSVQPGNDFYEYANGGWLKNNPLPGEYSRYGAFDKLAEDNQKMVKNLIEDAAAQQNEQGSIDAKVGTFYSTGMDTVTIEQQGITPLKEDLAKIDAAKSVEDIQDLISEWHTGNNSVLFHLYGSPDDKNSSMVIANLIQGGLGLTDVAYYREQDAKAKEIRETYLNYVARMLTIAGESPEMAKKDAELIMKMETRLAYASMTRLERRDPHATYNKMPVSELESLSPHFNWDGYLDELGLSGVQEINVAQPKFFEGSQQHDDGYAG